MKSFITVSRGYLDFLANEGGEGDRGTTRAFLFDNLLKSLVLIVDEVINQFDKSANQRVVDAVRRVHV
jgi:hypothetical protein